MKKTILLFLIILLAFPCLVFAAVDADLRLKLGSAAGADEIKFENAIGHGSNKSGTNAQIEVVLGTHQDSLAGFIMTIGFFHRQHSEEIHDLTIPLKVDYSVTGMSIAPGVRFRISDAFNVEVKLEAGLSSEGRVTLDSPGIDWNATKAGNYGSVSLIAGGYYLFKGSSLRIGVEVGMQEFRGDFKIWSNSGNWSSGNVSGEGETVNMVCGYQF